MISKEILDQAISEFNLRSYRKRKNPEFDSDEERGSAEFSLLADLVEKLNNTVPGLNLNKPDSRPE